MRNFLLSFSLGLIILLFILFLTSSSSIANKGEARSYFTIQVQNQHLSKKDSVRFTPIINTNLTAAVFGYLPSWQYQNARKNIKYELLTHIAVFNFQVDHSGNITNPDDWPWTDIITEGHRNGVKIIMTLFNSDSTETHNILTDSLARKNTFSNIKKNLSEYSIDGVNVDFELLKRCDRNSVINSFMFDLSNYLHSEIPGVEVSFAGPAVNWGGWDFKGLAEACDYIFIMGYDYFPQTSLVSGPSASLGGAMYSIESTVLNEFFGYGDVTRDFPGKLILGVPYFGNHWTTETGEPQSMNLQHVESITYKSAIEESKKHKILWQSSFQVPWYRYQVNGIWHQVWFDNQKSIGLKYDFAISHGFKGVGIWALGFDGDRPELWNEIKKRFFVNYPFGLMAMSTINDSTGNFSLGSFIPKALKLVEAAHRGGV